MSDHSTPSSAVAYSYIRFSSPEQAKGDSLRRQTAKTAEWCQRNNVHLDTTISLRDLGVSAYKGRHRDDKHALGAFLKLAERGRIPTGSYLVIENLDRLSREDERKALRLWMDILDAGINIVQLTPETVFRHEKSDMIDVMRAIIELSRGHSESRIKSERLAAAWRVRKDKAREEGQSISSNLPGWIRETEEWRELIPEHADTVRRIYQLAAQGYGHGRIVRLITDEGVPCFGRKGVWCRAYIALILRDRRSIGECQPRFKGGAMDGKPIPGFYPPVVTEDEWEAAQTGKKGRRMVHKPVEPSTVLELRQEGKNVAAIAKELKISRPRVYRVLAAQGQHAIQERGNHYVHLFSGLLTSARDGKPYYPAVRISNGKPYRVLISSSSAEKTGKAHGFPYDVFEQAVLSCLREIDAKEVLEGTNGHDDLFKLETEYNRLEASLDALSADMDENGESPTLLKRVREKEAQQKEVSKQLEAARRKAKNPLSAAWGEAKGLIAALESDEARLRLRAALRRIVKAIYVLVVHKGKDRLALVQIDFTDGPHREYFIRNRQTTAFRKGFWQVVSYCDDEYMTPAPATAALADLLVVNQLAEWMTVLLDDVDKVFDGCERHPLP